MTDRQNEFKQLRNQIFDLSEQFSQLYDSYESLEALIIDGDAVHCRAVLNTLNYRFRDNLKSLDGLHIDRNRRVLRLVSNN